MHIIGYGFLVVLFCLSAGMASIAVAGYRMDRSQAPADAAVVFGATVHENGQPSRLLRARLERALELYQTGRVKQIVTSGGLGREGHDEAQVMAGYLVERGVAEEALIIDSSGVNTLASARFAARRFSPDTRIIVVSQFFHVPRAWLAFKKMGFKHIQGASVGYLYPGDIYSLAREAPALVVYFCRRP